MNNPVNAWAGNFGVDYTIRNLMPADELDKIYRARFGISRSEMNKSFIGNLDRDIKILEVGSNVGLQLTFLQDMGFKNLYGIELLPYAVEVAKSQTKNINIIQGSAYDVPFRDNYFDMVFTSGLLIHIPPENIKVVISEIVRCSKSYIWGYEYYSSSYQAIEYRGKDGILWKADFASIYQNSFPFLKLVKSEQLHYRDSENVDAMFLLRRR